MQNGCGCTAAITPGSCAVDFEDVRARGMLAGRDGSDLHVWSHMHAMETGQKILELCGQPLQVDMSLSNLDKHTLPQAGFKTFLKVHLSCWRIGVNMHKLRPRQGQ